MPQVPDRRLAPRVPVTGSAIEVVITPSDAPARLLDVSPGGCLLSTDAPVLSGRFELVFLSADHRWFVRLGADVAHSRPSPTSSGEPRQWLAGFRFADRDKWETLWLIDELLERVAHRDGRSIRPSADQEAWRQIMILGDHR